MSNISAISSWEGHLHLFISNFIDGSLRPSWFFGLLFLDLRFFLLRLLLLSYLSFPFGSFRGITVSVESFANAICGMLCVLYCELSCLLHLFFFFLGHHLEISYELFVQKEIYNWGLFRARKNRALFSERLKGHCWILLHVPLTSFTCALLTENRSISLRLSLLRI